MSSIYGELSDSPSASSPLYRINKEATRADFLLATASDGEWKVYDVPTGGSPLDSVSVK